MSNKNPTVIVNSNIGNVFSDDNIPNIFGMNVRPSSGEVVSPTSESSRQSIRKDHMSKENKFQLNIVNSSCENSDCLSLESIVVNREHKHQVSRSEKEDELSTPHFITKRSSANYHQL